MHMSSVFFFKQKTAYEMRISDWSSDVCSSDLPESGEVEFDQGTISDVLPNRRKIGGIEQAHTDGVETGQQRLTLSLPTFQGYDHTSGRTRFIGTVGQFAIVVGFGPRIADEHAHAGTSSAA